MHNTGIIFRTNTLKDEVITVLTLFEKSPQNTDFHRYGLQNVAYYFENVWKRIEMHYSVHDMLRRFQQLLLARRYTTLKIDHSIRNPYGDYHDG